MFYTVYKVTNKINNKYYIGKHQTKNLNDDYMGSGKLIKRAIKKYGIENFIKEILFVFDNEKEMNDKEKELVLLNEMSYNLCYGGKGGFGFINDKKLNLYGKNGSSEHGLENLSFGRIYIKNLTESELINYKNKLSKSHKKKYTEGYENPFKNKKHKQETKEKIGLKNKESQKGIKNSQFGSYWITNGIINKKIKSLDLIPEGWYKGRSY
jgi:hypothetical protein